MNPFFGSNHRKEAATVTPADIIYQRRCRVIERAAIVGVAQACTRAVEELELTHHRTPPRSPDYNAVAERFHGTVLQECSPGRPLPGRPGHQLDHREPLAHAADHRAAWGQQRRRREGGLPGLGLLDRLLHLPPEGRERLDRRHLLDRAGGIAPGRPAVLVAGAVGRRVHAARTSCATRTATPGRSRRSGPSPWRCTTSGRTPGGPCGPISSATGSPPR